MSGCTCILTGRAKLTFHPLPEDIQVDYCKAKAALKERFELVSQKIRHLEVHQTSRKMKAKSRTDVE